MNVVVRPMVSSDLDAVLDIQRACYGEGFLEGADVITRRIASSDSRPHRGRKAVAR